MLYTFVKPAKKTLNLRWNPLLPTSKTNTFSEIYEQRLRKYTASFKFDETIRGTFQCEDFELLSPAQSLLVLENREIEHRLPLDIKESTLGGYGVFATKSIPANTIVCSYLGEMRLLENVNWYDENDSAFEFGWIGDKCMVVYTLAYSNIGRFFNNNKHDANCAIFRSLLKAKGKKVEPSLVLYTTRDVEKDEELTYWYGDEYKKFDE